MAAAPYPPGPPAGGPEREPPGSGPHLLRRWLRHFDIQRNIPQNSASVNAEARRRPEATAEPRVPVRRASLSVAPPRQHPTKPQEKYWQRPGVEVAPVAGVW